MTKAVLRGIAPRFLEAAASLPVVVLTGMRQTGKTWFLRHQPELSTGMYSSLDDPSTLEAARRNPESLLAGKGPVLIDEAQKCPELFPIIKILVDEDHRPGRFVLSGSANFLLLRRVTESLAGRALYLTLQPLSRREVFGLGGTPFVKALYDASGGSRRTAAFPFSTGLVMASARRNAARLTLRVRPTSIEPKHALIGGFPPVALKNADPELWMKGYEQTYLERDVRDLSQVGDLISFRQILHAVAFRTAQVLNQSELGRDAKLNQTTTSRYLNLLEASFVITRVPPYLRNPATRLIKSPKLYVSDSGLAAFLTGALAQRMKTQDRLAGALLETFVFQNLAAILEASWPQARLCYWNVQGRYEVDFIIDAGQDCLAVEVTTATRWGKGDLAGLEAFLEATPHCRAAILAYNGTQAVSLGERLWAVPLSVVLS